MPTASNPAVRPAVQAVCHVRPLSPAPNQGAKHLGAVAAHLQLIFAAEWHAVLWRERWASPPNQKQADLLQYSPACSRDSQQHTIKKRRHCCRRSSLCLLCEPKEESPQQEKERRRDAGAVTHSWPHLVCTEAKAHDVGPCSGFLICCVLELLNPPRRGSHCGQNPEACKSLLLPDVGKQSTEVPNLAAAGIPIFSSPPCSLLRRRNGWTCMHTQYIHTYIHTGRERSLNRQKLMLKRWGSVALD